MIGPRKAVKILKTSFLQSKNFQPPSWFLVGYELIPTSRGANQITEFTEYLISDGSLYNNW